MKRTNICKNEFCRDELDDFSCKEFDEGP